MFSQQRGCIIGLLNLVDGILYDDNRILLCILMTANDNHSHHDEQDINTSLHNQKPINTTILTMPHLPKCILILEAKMSTTTGLEPRGRMMSALRLVGSMNCWCMGLTKVW